MNQPTELTLEQQFNLSSFKDASGSNEPRTGSRILSQSL
jgi:hypothetical protein